LYGLGLRALADVGCDAALDGHDGDGALGNPFARYSNAVLDGQLDRLAAAVRRAGPRFVLSEIVKGFVSPSVLSRLLRRPVSPGYLGSFLPYFRGETALRVAAESRWQPPRAGWERQQLKALHPPITQFFEEFELLGACHGIDVRHPFADRDLIDFLIRLPHAVKASTVRPKPLLRYGLADLLPSPVAERDGKTPFTALLDARIDFENCYRWVRDSGVRLPDIDYGRLFRDAARPVNDRIFWARLANAHVFLAGV
jgi:Asparagine synthase